VRDAYLQLAQAEPDRIKIVNTNQPPELTHERVKQIVVPFLRSRGHLASDQLGLTSMSEATK
jgi:thymidylate kinase